MVSKILLSALLPIFGILCATGTERAPNIVYILVDDAGYSDFSCYGQKKFNTPNIDALAKRGMKFTHHYSGSTVCAPTRSCLMTGQHTGHTPIRGNRAIKNDSGERIGESPIPDEAITVAEVLKKQGYATGAFGKWGLGYPGSEGEPLKQGFDRFYGYNSQWNAHTYYPTWLYDDQKKITLDGKTYSAPLIHEKALEWIREKKDGPFFAFLPLTIPHAAMHVPEEFAAPFRKKFPQFENTEAKYGNNVPVTKNPAAQFAGMMKVLDDGVGQVVALIDELGLSENTLIIFSSDNGPHKEGGHLPDFFDSNGPFTGHKRSLTEGGIRVPMIATWKGKISPGVTSEHVSAHWDILPTLAEISGANTPKGLDGISMVPTLLSGGIQKKHSHLYWEFHEQKGKRAVRFGDQLQWKAVQRNIIKKPNSPIMIFNLENDPSESKNLAGNRKDLVAEAITLFKASRTKNPTFTFPWEN